MDINGKCPMTIMEKSSLPLGERDNGIAMGLMIMPSPVHIKHHQSMIPCYMCKILTKTMVSGWCCI